MITQEGNVTDIGAMVAAINSEVPQTPHDAPTLILPSIMELPLGFLSIEKFRKFSNI
jgi:hypothetical protein